MTLEDAPATQALVVGLNAGNHFTHTYGGAEDLAKGLSTADAAAHAAWLRHVNERTAVTVTSPTYGRLAMVLQVAHLSPALAKALDVEPDTLVFCWGPAYPMTFSPDSSQELKWKCLVTHFYIVADGLIHRHITYEEVVAAMDSEA